MKTGDNRHFTAKLYVIIALCACICVCLIFLLATGSKQEAVTAGIQSELISGLDTLPEPNITEEPVWDMHYDITSDESLTRIANKERRTDSGYIPADLVSVNVSSNGNVQLRKEAAVQLEVMFEASQQDGISLYLISGYRSYERQTQLYEYYCEKYGTEEADRMDAVPGVSEHMLGLSVDLGTADHAYELEDGFALTSAYAWLVEHSYEYGYVLRYPQGKEEITGTAFSPWSFRYFGVDTAKRIHDSGLCAEEYFEVNS